jgi:peptidoglycan LD-endopeptidase LytH
MAVHWRVTRIVLVLLALCGLAGGGLVLLRELSRPAPAANPVAVAPSSSAVPLATVAPSAPPAAASRGASRAPVRYVFPVIGKVSYAHTHHDYPATDIITACGNRVLAATSGVVLTVTRVDTWSPSVNAGATRGGLSVSILGADGVRYYGSHMESIDARVAPGVRVTAGQPLGRVGQTGDASACHLHFGISPPCGQRGDWWIQRGVVWPWRYLDSWRRHGSLSAVPEVAAWHAAHGCPTHPLVDP